MGITLSKESKSAVDLSLESKDDGLIWDEATWSWDEETGTWALPKLTLSKESKSGVSLSMESK